MKTKIKYLMSWITMAALMLGSLGYAQEAQEPTTPEPEPIEIAAEAVEVETAPEAEPIPEENSEETESETVPEVVVIPEESVEVATSTDSADDVASSSDPIAEEPAVAATTTPTDNVATTTLETATSTDSVEGTNSTGGNTTATSTPETPETSSSTPEIVSGQAVALANILNIVNTNFINSDGVIMFSNFFEYLAQTLDLRNFFSPTASTTCPTVPCTSGDYVSINLNNNATITNSILLQASSGGNYISGVGDASITTGPAYTGLNLVNLANNSFVDSNYLLVTLNAFGGVGGDIVFPSLSDFFQSLAGGGSATNIDVTNQATINNNINANTNSGGNHATTTGESNISTGDAHSSANVFNGINGNFLGGQNISILFRVHGDWAGEIFGAPEGLSWFESDDGSIYLFDAGSAASSTNNSTNVDGTNTTLIENDISVIALTGNNHIDGAQTALISTGNAFAGVNLVNVANQTVVGQNWILAIINIFGDFTGNIAFGRPDLWVGAQADSPSNLKNGSEVTYKFTVINNGDAESSDTILTVNSDQSQLNIIDGEDLSWELGTIPPGGAAEISYRARVTTNAEGAQIVTEAAVAGHETDNNTEDNSEVITITTDRTSSGGNSRRRPRQPLEKTLAAPATPQQIAMLNVTRTTLATVLENGENRMHQELIVVNPTDTDLGPIVLQDILRDPWGKEVQREVWNLGTVLAREEIVLGYDTVFGPNAPRGLYSLSTDLAGFDSSSVPNGYVLLTFVTFGPPISVSSTPTTPEEITEPEPMMEQISQARESWVPTKITASLALAADTVDNYPPNPPSMPWQVSAFLIVSAVTVGAWKVLVSLI